MKVVAIVVLVIAVAIATVVAVLPASLIDVPSCSQSTGTTVTLTGSRWTSAGSFWAVTVTGGSVIDGGCGVP